MDRPLQRAARRLAGLVLFAVALAMLVKARLGPDPWNVFVQALSRQTGLSLGTITVIVSILLLALWIALAQRPGLGTTLNAPIIEPVLDLALR